MSDLVDLWINQLNRRLESLISETEGSGFIISRVEGFYINYCLHAAFNGIGDYVAYPRGVRGGHEVFNPNGRHSSCVIQCLAAFKLHTRGLSWGKIHKILKRRHGGEKFITRGRLQNPVTWENLSQLERLNNLSINVYTLTKSGERYYLTMSRKGSLKYRAVVPLLLLSGRHMTLIKNVKKIIQKIDEKSTHTWGVSVLQNLFHCTSQLCQPKWSRVSLWLHPITSLRGGWWKSKIQKFRLYIPPTYLAFFDFESMVKPNENGSVIAEHEAIGYSYLIINRQDDVEKRTYFGVDASNDFIKSLSESWRIIKKSTISYPIDMTADEDYFRRQGHCELCHQPFDEKNRLHRHHDHSVPRNNYRGAWCARCNLQCRDMRKYLISLAHNMSLDVSLIIKRPSTVRNERGHPRQVRVAVIESED